MTRTLLFVSIVFLSLVVGNAYILGIAWLNHRSNKALTADSLLLANAGVIASYPYGKMYWIPRYPKLDHVDFRACPSDYASVEALLKKLSCRVEVVFVSEMRFSESEADAISALPFVGGCVRDNHGS